MWRSDHRQLFGQPIGKFQAIRVKIADMVTEVEAAAARALTYQVADAIDYELFQTRF